MGHSTSPAPTEALRRRRASHSRPSDRHRRKNYRLSLIANGDTQTYAYSPTTNRLTQAGNDTRVLDAAGNTVSDTNGVRSFSYYGNGRLQQVKRHGRKLGTYIYDFRGLRTQKLKGGPDTVYHYDQDGRLLGESDAKGSFQKLYVWLNDRPLAQVESGRTETLVYLHTDHLGTPRLATDVTQAIVWRWDGDAFGTGLPAEDADSNRKATTVNLRYAGQYYDQETGLHYNWNRYYDPRTGRYVTSDPIGLRGGLNTYLYVRANPLRWTDPRGLDIAGGWEPGSDISGGPTSTSLGLGAFGMGGTGGGSVSFGKAWDSMGNSCWYTSICPALGYGFAAGVGFEGSTGTGRLCEGEYRTFGPFITGGAGPFGEGGVQSSGDDISFGRGIYGAGAGFAAGGMMCVTRVFGCLKPCDDNACKR